MSIEIILQDAEAPVDPTPTPETNIVVPDTGAGVVGSGSTFSSSSVANIILPAILLVVVLATICTALIHKHYKHQNSDRFSKKEKLATVADSTIAILAATVLVGNLVMPATKATSDDAGSTNTNNEGELVVDDKITITVTREENSDEAIVASMKNTSYVTADYDFGYKVTASMAEGLGNANLYLDGDETSEYYIAPVEDGELTDNTWGYTLEEPSEDTSYLSIPLSTKPTTMVKEIAQIAEDKPVDIYYTVQIDKDIPNGTYIGELEYTLSPAIEYMQDFASLTAEEKTATLTNMPEGKQYILKDTRDEKPYYISKLADGNVWMTQNLDHDIVSTPNFYTSSNTDLPNGNVWTGTATRITSDMTWSNSSTVPESYDPGNRYWDGVVNDNWGGNIDDDTTTAGEPHYHIGNHYNWTAAIASSDSSSYDSQQEITQSICPAGWKLPGVNEGESYLDIVSLYNLTSGVDGNIQDAPAYFAYSSQWAGSKNNETGNFGYLWTNEVSYSEGAKAFYFDFFKNKGLNDYDNRRYGFSIRCLVR